MLLFDTSKRYTFMSVDYITSVQKTYFSLEATITPECMKLHLNGNHFYILMFSVQSAHIKVISSIKLTDFYVLGYLS